jgi:hypothetical protein
MDEALADPRHKAEDDVAWKERFAPIKRREAVAPHLF